MELTAPNLVSLVHSNTTFALDLYHQIRDIQGNLFFSPFSISTALAMTYAGSRGETQVQMANALQFRQEPESLHRAFAALDAHLNAIQQAGDVKLSVANGLWPDGSYAMLPEYLELMKKFYGVSITSMNFADAETARARINAWVEEQTANKIKELIVPGVITPLTRLILTNAIYFKGNWARQFDESNTRDLPFHLSPGQSVAVPMMTQTKKFGYAETDNLQVLELPYEGDELSFIALLPKQGRELAKIEAMLSIETLQAWTSGLRKREVRVILPRFKVEASFRLDKVLQTLGMSDAFNAEKADFSDMDGVAMLFITAVLHKAFVEVNEEGTEAAAATAVIMGVRSMPMPPPVFRADHPFLYLIRERATGSILFLGRLSNPG